jgi:hypothetical protein
MPKLTRKHSSKGTPFPLIRKKLDTIRDSASKKPSVEEFCALWKKLFGKTLPKKLAKEYIDIVEKNKGQSGGYGGAPLTYDMRPPDVLTKTVPYVQSGFGFANENTGQSGAKEYLGSSAVPPDATNQFTKLSGGARNTRKGKKRQSGGAQWFGMNSPPTTLQVAGILASGGKGISASPLPEVNTGIIRS